MEVLNAFTLYVAVLAAGAILLATAELRAARDSCVDVNPN